MAARHFHSVEIFGEGQSHVGSFDAQGDKRETVALMKIATHLNRAPLETARMMILVAPEGIDPSVFNGAISAASDEAERLEIAAITAGAALEDTGNKEPWLIHQAEVCHD